MPPPSQLPLPAVDERLVMPESRFEIHEGRIEYVAPADELHGSRHSKLSALLEAHVHPDFDVAVDMLTRTSVTSDIAPDASVFPIERDPITEMRQIEQLAFEVVSTERLSHAASKADQLTRRGVRRVFAIDVERRRALEWSKSLNTWQLLAHDATIADPVLAVSLPISALVSASRADDAMAAALLAKENPILSSAIGETRRASRLEGRLEGKLEGEIEGELKGRAKSIIDFLHARGLEVPAALREQILCCRDLNQLERWVQAAARVASATELLDA